MSIENHVVSLSLAKQLWEAGIKIESVFSWTLTTATGSQKWMLQNVESWKGSKATIKSIPAPLVSELGELLPVKAGQVWWTQKQVDGAYIGYIHGITIGYDEKNEANVRAKMLLYLHQNHLLPNHGGKK